MISFIKNRSKELYLLTDRVPEDNDKNPSFGYLPDPSLVYKEYKLFA